MPRRDGTGPDGKGPKTGRGDGPCKPNDQLDKAVDSERGHGGRRGGRRGGGRKHP